MDRCNQIADMNYMCSRLPAFIASMQYIHIFHSEFFCHECGQLNEHLCAVVGQVYKVIIATLVGVILILNLQCDLFKNIS